MTAFTSALYYPCVSNPNEAWLKSAILYWDSIQTIVPAYSNRPYTGKIAEMLYDNGLLKPLFVNSDMPEIEALTEDVLTYLDSPEGKKILKSRSRSTSQKRRIIASKMPRRVIHSSKMPRAVISRVRHVSPKKLESKIKRMVDKSPSAIEEWLELDDRFADFYITLLATRLSDNRGIGLVTDVPAIDNFAQVAKLGCNSANSQLAVSSQNDLLNQSKYSISEKVPSTLAQGLLVNLVVERIKLSPESSVEDILKFRQKYSTELGILRANIDELTKAVSGDKHPEHLAQEIRDIYTTRFEPNVVTLKRILRASRLKYVVEGLKVALISTSVTAFLPQLGLSIPHALIAGAALTVTTTAVAYNYDKVEKLAKSPYLYLMMAKKKLP